MAEYNNLIEESVVNRLEIFAKALDNKSVARMKECLTDEVIIDFNTHKGEAPVVKSALEYIEQCIDELRNINSTHNFTRHKILMIEDKVHCQCDFSIKRFDLRQNEYFHSYGRYTFILGNVEFDWKIEKIVQMMERSEGVDLIHGAFSVN